MKQNGAVLAKGWLLGLQFYTLLKDGTYFTITKKADEQAMRIKEAFHKKEISEYMGSYTNQQFVILSKEQEEKLSQKYILSWMECCRMDAAWCASVQAGPRQTKK